MKCGIITYHRASNYGAVLQTYALQKTIQSLGCNVEILDYRSQFIEDHYSFPKIWKEKGLKRFIAALLFNGEVFSNRASFDLFREKHLSITKRRYIDRTELASANEEFDLFITGSDQVWSPYTAGFDETYFLDFVENSDKKYSYAASFGVDKIPQELHARYSELLNDFNLISVREDTGVNIVQEVSNRDSIVVVDPTFLLSTEQWGSIASKPDCNQEYILVFLIAEDQQILKQAQQLSLKSGLKIIYISNRIYKRFGMKNASNVPVETWLGYFKSASYIFTNSFHGIAFSLIFEKRVNAYHLPGKALVNGRISQLLLKSGLKETVFQIDNEDFRKQNIDYKKVKALLGPQIKLSLQYLCKILNLDKV